MLEKIVNNGSDHCAVWVRDRESCVFLVSRPDEVIHNGGGLRTRRSEGK